MTDDDYAIEFFVYGERVALCADLNLAAEKTTIVYQIVAPTAT